MKTFLTMLVALVCAAPAFAGERLDERAQVEFLKEKYNAQSEVRQWDNTRVDLLSPTHAYEVDWAHNYAEGVGQAVYYGCITERKAGLILLVNDIQKEQRFIYRAKIACHHAGVELFVELAKKPVGQQAPKQELATADDPVYVYLIYDPQEEKYYRTGTLGLSGWGKITEANAWMVKKTAERTLAGMYGSRANRCVIKKFLLLPAKQEE